MPISQPRLIVPNPPQITSLEFKPPSAKIPSFPPIVVPPSNLQRPAGVKAEETKQTQPETPKLDIPVLDIQLPLPTADVVATATYAAVAAVATTTLATPFFDQIKKKLQKFIQGKVDKWKEKRNQKRKI